MIINKFQSEDIVENYLNIYYKTMDAEIIAVLSLFKIDKKIIGKNAESEEVISPGDVYYFEIVDRKCFAYLQSKVLLVELSLQNIIDRYAKDGFIRISKSMVVNVYKLVKIKSDLNMRVIAALENGETVIVNRSYRREFYKSIRNLLEKGDDYENNQ